jgi:tetratricopeptide (TPR) repeat protein
MPMDIKKLTQHLTLLTFDRHTIFVAKNNPAIKAALIEVSIMINESTGVELTAEEKIYFIKGCEQLGLYFAFSYERDIKSAVDLFKYSLQLAEIYEHPPVHLESMLIYLNLIKRQANNGQALIELRLAIQKLKSLIAEKKLIDTMDEIFQPSELYYDYMFSYVFLLRAEADELIKRAFTNNLPADRVEFDNKFSVLLSEALTGLDELTLSSSYEAELAHVYALQGWGAYLSKQYVAANEYYSKAVQHWHNFNELSGTIHHHTADTLYRLGLVVCRLGENDDAIFYFKEAIKIARNYFETDLNNFIVEVKFNLATAYLVCRSTSKAFKEFTKLLPDAKQIKFEKVIIDTEAMIKEITDKQPSLKDRIDSKEEPTDSTLANLCLSVTNTNNSVRFFPTASPSTDSTSSPSMASTPSAGSTPSVSLAP